MLERIGTWLSSPATTRWLAWANVVVTCALLWAARSVQGSDHLNYLALAEGIGHGEYSSWWWLPVDVPDTMRTPGYPLFLWALTSWTGSFWPLRLVQLLAYGAAMRLVYLSIGHMGGGRLARNLFLLVLLPSVNIAWYVPHVGTETLAVLFMSAWLYVQVAWKDQGWRKPVVHALLLAGAFQCRPVILLFPVLWSAVRLWTDRDHATWRAVVLELGVFALLLVPYGLWNRAHHGVFSVTPLESGGGVMHIGWWSGKIPGRQESRYWGNATGEEMLRFTPPEQVPANWQAFQAEWDAIDRELAPLLTSTDSLMLRAHLDHPMLFRTYTTRYTLERERILKRTVWRHVLEEPGYTLAIKSYALARLYVTGVHMGQWRTWPLQGRLRLLYPFLLSLMIFVLAWVAVPWAMIRKGLRFLHLAPLLMPLIYFGLIHLPFTLQARYTIPVRALLLALVALALERILERRRDHGDAARDRAEAPPGSS